MTPERIIGIGETVYDILFRDDQPQKAVPGGSTFNSIVSLGRAGMNCVMVTEVGGDHVGDIICNYLQENGVSTEYVCRHESKMLRGARAAGAWLYYDVNFRKNHIAELPEVMPNIEENMRLADVVRGSTEDFEYLYGLRDGTAIYERVRRYCPTLILTDGARPIRLYSPEGCESYPVERIVTVSTIGAGDNFNAGYIYARLKGLDDRIGMAQRWSQDVCRQLGNNISDALVETLKKQAL